MKKFVVGLVVLTGLMFFGVAKEAFAHGGPGGYGGGGYGGGGFGYGGGGYGGGGYGHRCHSGGFGGYGGGYYMRPMPRPVYVPYNNFYGSPYGGYGGYGGSGFGLSIVKPGFGFSVNNYGW